MKRKSKIAILLLIATIAYLFFQGIVLEKQGYTPPNSESIDLSQILANPNKTIADYDILFHQTGLGKSSINTLLSNANGTEKIAEFQKDFLTSRSTVCEKINILTREESLVDDEYGGYINGFELAPYKNGDILISKSTHTLSFRHGHAGMVIDENTTVESIMLGENSTKQDIDKWRSYSTFIMLRPIATDESTLEKIVDYTITNMNDKPYKMLIGLGGKDIELELLDGTHCAHLVWFPYKQFGYDIDSDKGWLVTPKDIANSDLFEVVQIYGVDPDNIWK